MRFNSALLFSDNPKALISFYTKVFGKEPKWQGGEFNGFDLTPGTLFIGPHDKVHGKNPNPERIMLNFEVDDIQAEFVRIKGGGAKVIAEPYEPTEEKGMMLATFEDPDGNYFQLGTPMQM